MAKKDLQEDAWTRRTRGLYANINARKKAGKRAKRPGENGYPSAEAFRRSAKTARNQSR